MAEIEREDSDTEASPPAHMVHQINSRKVALAKIPVRRETASSAAIHDAHRRERCHALPHEFTRTLAERLQISGNQIPARKRHPIEAHQSRTMRVREHHEHALIRLSARLRDTGD